MVKVCERFRGFIIATAFILSFSGVALAQTAGANLKGYITDALRINSPIVGATLTLRSVDNAPNVPTYTATSNASGYYEINNIIWWLYTSHVEYKLYVSASGYQNYTSPTLSFNPGVNQNNVALGQTGAELKGIISGQTGNPPLGGITLTLKPTVYGYGSRDYSVVSDANGNYDFTGVLRAVYTSGGAQTWLDYHLYVSASGYVDYVSETINFLNFAYLYKDVRLTPTTTTGSVLTNEVSSLLTQGYIAKLSVKEIEYRYLPISVSSLAKKEVKQFKVSIDMYYRGVLKQHFDDTIILEPGQRIIDGLMLCDGTIENQESGFLFYKNDSGLGYHFSSLESSLEKTDAQGRLSMLTLSGKWAKDATIPVVLERSNFVYNADGAPVSYSSRLTIQNNPSGLPGGSVDALTIKKITYDTQKRPLTVTLSHFYGPSTNWNIYYLRYNRDEEVVGFYMQMTR